MIGTQSRAESIAHQGFLSAIVTSVAEGICAIDVQGRVTFLNPAAEEMLGYQKADLIGALACGSARDSSGDIRPFLPPDCGLLSVLDSGIALRDQEEVLVRRDGSAFPALCSSAPILTENTSEGKTIVGAVIAFTDITEQKKARTELQSAYQREHRIAETLQRSLLMRPPVDAFAQLEVETIYEAASDEAKLGGDFYDAFALLDGRIALVVGDICGQGLSAAAWSAELKYALRAFLFSAPSPGYALARLNAYLDHTRSSGVGQPPPFVALCVAVVSTKGGRSAVAAAGIEPPLLLQADGQTRALMAQGLPLGIMPGERYEEVAFELSAGDSLLMSTDGITEARRGRVLLGADSLAELARQTVGIPSAREAARYILEGVRAFATNGFTDDVCLLLAKRV